MTTSRHTSVENATSVFVVLNRSDSAKSVGNLPGGSYTDELSGEQVDGPSVMVPARGSRVLVAN